MVLHLSDFHITSNRDIILSRFSQIADAVKNLDYSLELCVIVVTGDLSYAGKEEQCAVAWEFLKQLRDELTGKLTARDSNNAVPVHFVAVP
jgi:predicted MPP superfamily phosphohydrolase